MTAPVCPLSFASTSPRSPEHRRHTAVSGDRRYFLEWNDDLRWRVIVSSPEGSEEIGRCALLSEAKDMAQVHEDRARLSAHRAAM